MKNFHNLKNWKLGQTVMHRDDNAIGIVIVLAQPNRITVKWCDNTIDTHTPNQLFWV